MIDDPVQFSERSTLPVCYGYVRAGSPIALASLPFAQNMQGRRRASGLPSTLPRWLLYLSLAGRGMCGARRSGLLARVPTGTTSHRNLFGGGGATNTFYSTAPGIGHLRKRAPGWDTEAARELRHS